MPIIYNGLKFLHHFALKAYFRSIHIEGQENFPAEGAVILAVNHPSAFMDPIIVATLSKRRVAFLTAAEFFYNRFFSWFYGKLGMIPIYRPHVMRHMIDKNTNTFEACYSHLEVGGALMIFPEGTSKTEYHIRPNKTGLARIAFETAERNNFDLPIHVVPVGLVYDDPHVYGTHLLVQYGEAIEVEKWYEQYQHDPRAAVRGLTAETEHRLKRLTWHLEEEELHGIFETCKKALWRQPFKNTEDAKLAFDEAEKIAAKLHYWHRSQPDLLKRLEQSVIEEKPLLMRQKLKHLPGLLLGFPLYAYGKINNWAALVMPEMVLRIFRPRYDFRGSVRLLSSLIAFLIFSMLQTALVYHWSENAPLALLYFFSIALSGWYAKRYEETFIQVPKQTRDIGSQELREILNRLGSEQTANV